MPCCNQCVLGPVYVHVPQDINKIREKTSQFELKYGMTQAFGCIDGNDVGIKRPPNSSKDFNYKQFVSLNVQAVCDSKGYFMDVECKWPVHDGKGFANPSVSKNLNSAKRPITYLPLLHGYAAIPNYLIGDPAPPL